MDGGKVTAEQDGGNFRQTLAELGAGVRHRCAVQVRACRSGGRGRIWNLAGAGGHDTHSFEIEPQAFGRDLLDLGVQPLSHFRAAVIHLDAAIAINQHQRRAPD